MTLEELKREAKKQGYYLIEIKPNVRKLRCSCGKRAKCLWTNKGKIIMCRSCGARSTPENNERNAWKAWNKMQCGNEYGKEVINEAD